MEVNSNIVLGILVACILGATIYYLSQNNQQPIPNDGYVDALLAKNGYAMQNAPLDVAAPPAGYLNNTAIQRPLQPQIMGNRRADEVSGDIVSDIVSQYTVEDRPIDGGAGSFGASDPMYDSHGKFSNYGEKRQLNMRKTDEAYSDDIYDSRDYSYRPHRMRNKDGEIMRSDSDSDSGSDRRDFVHKKQQFTMRTPSNIKDQFDSSKLQPVEIENDWFDVEPLLTTKKITDTHLLHPMVHMGVNTVGSTLRNGTHDIRGDIPNPKMNVSPWNNSTIEPDTNIKGICNSA